MSATALYRHFNEAGHLLYVGIALDQLSRLKQHEKSAAWHREIARVEIEWFPTRGAALDAERAAVRAEAPVFNIRLQEKDRKGRFVVSHPFSNRCDGIYFTLYGARGALEEWRATFPKEVFSVEELPVGMVPALYLEMLKPIWVEHKAIQSAAHAIFAAEPANFNMQDFAE